MALGDFVEVRVGFPGGTDTVRVTASKRGRTVRVRQYTLNRVRWLDVEETVRGGAPTGTKVSARLDTVLSIREQRAEPPVSKPARLGRVKVYPDAAAR